MGNNLWVMFTIITAIHGAGLGLNLWSGSREAMGRQWGEVCLLTKPV